MTKKLLKALKTKLSYLITEFEQIDDKDQEYSVFVQTSINKLVTKAEEINFKLADVFLTSDGIISLRVYDLPKFIEFIFLKDQTISLIADESDDVFNYLSKLSISQTIQALNYYGDIWNTSGSYQDIVTTKTFKSSLTRISSSDPMKDYPFTKSSVFSPKQQLVVNS